MNQIAKFTSLLLMLSSQTILFTDGHTLERGALCENGNLKVNPKFKSSHQTCDDTKGLACIDSENPEFLSGRNASQICDCTEDFYFDSVSEECRIQVGFRCDPEVLIEDEGTMWKDKCPENAYCSRDVGRYGPKGAKGMCRCKDGFSVSSVWFVGGGGTVCEKEEEERLKNYPLGIDYDFQETNGLIIG